jgi:hypothetical protein
MGDMDALLEREVRASFVNCSRGQAQRAALPVLADQPWDDLDYLGWVDPKAPQAGFIVTHSPAHGLVGLALRRNPSTGGRRARMCSLCTTVHSGQGVALMVARRAGRSGRDGNTVGLDVCAGLDCSLHARGLVPAPAMSVAHETLPVEAKVARLRHNLDGFVERVLRGT